MKTVRYGEKHNPYVRPVVTTTVVPEDDGSKDWAMLYGKGHDGPFILPEDPPFRILTEHRLGMSVVRYG